MAQRRLSDQELKTAAVKVGAIIDPNDPRNVLFSGNEEAFRKEIQAVAERPPVIQKTVVDDQTDASSSQSMASRIVPSALRIVPAILGGVAGGVSGSAVPVAGTAAGAAAGGAGGSALGEYLAQKYENWVDPAEDIPINKTQVAVQGVLGGLPIGKVLGVAAKLPGVKQAIVSPTMRNILGNVSESAVGRFFGKSYAPTATARLAEEFPRVVAKSAGRGATSQVVGGTATRMAAGEPTTTSDVLKDVAVGGAVGALVPGSTRVKSTVARALDTDLAAGTVGGIGGGYTAYRTGRGPLDIAIGTALGATSGVATRRGLKTAKAVADKYTGAAARQLEKQELSKWAQEARNMTEAENYLAKVKKAGIAYSDEALLVAQKEEDRIAARLSKEQADKFRQTAAAEKVLKENYEQEARNLNARADWIKATEDAATKQELESALRLEQGKIRERKDLLRQQKADALANAKEVFETEKHWRQVAKNENVREVYLTRLKAQNSYSEVEAIRQAELAWLQEAKNMNEAEKALRRIDFDKIAKARNAQLFARGMEAAPPSMRVSSSITKDGVTEMTTQTFRPTKEEAEESVKSFSDAVKASKSQGKLTPDEIRQKLSSTDDIRLVELAQEMSARPILEPSDPRLPEYKAIFRRVVGRDPVLGTEDYAPGTAQGQWRSGRMKPPSGGRITVTGLDVGN